MSVAVLIWASWLVLTSSGRVTALSVVDLAWFRAAIPAAVLLPVLWRNREHVARLGVKRCVLLSAYGAPFTLCVGYGLTFAPVAHAGAMVPGLMPVFAIALGAIFLGQRISPRKAVASLFILSGTGVILWYTSSAPEGDAVWVGHVLFLLGALCWACFAVTLGRSDVGPFVATAIVAALSVLVLTPILAFPGVSQISSADLRDVTFQAVFQGVLAGLVSLFAFGRALQLIGSRAAALTALTPGIAAVLAIPVLDQFPHGAEAAALILVILGLFVQATDAANAPKANHQTHARRD